MASAADIGANFSNYQGNAGLADVGLGVFNIDTKPLQQLASYTFFYNKAVFDQKQKDAEAAAKEISDYTSIDLTSGIAKDAKLLQSKWDKLNTFVRDHPESLNYKDREAWTEYKKLRGDLANDITGAGVRDKLNMARQKEIQDATTVAEKERLQKDLDAEIERTDIRTPLKYTNKFDIEPVKYAAPKKLSFTVSKEYPNYITGTEVLTTDMADVSGQANAAITGLSKFMNPQTDLEKQQYASQKNTGKLEPILSAQNLSAVIPQFVKDGKFDYDAAKKSGNSILAGNASNVQAYNRKMEDMTNAIKSGVFKDKLSGGVAAFGLNGINENDYQKIDLDKGYITPLEYAKLNIMGLAEPMVTSKTEIKPTGEANDLIKARMIQQGENDRQANEIAKDKYIANLPYEKQKAGAVGADGQPIDFGNLIYGINTPAKKVIDIFKSDGTKVPNLKINNGVFLDSKGNVFDYSGDIKIPATTIDNSIITEFNKYSGTTKLAADGTELSTPSTSKLVADNGFFTVRMENGEIKGIQADDGTFASANQFQHITLEAGQKGVTKYKKPDVNYGKLNNTKPNQKVDEYGVPIN